MKEKKSTIYKNDIGKRTTEYKVWNRRLSQIIANNQGRQVAVSRLTSAHNSSNHIKPYSLTCNKCQIEVVQKS